MLSSVPRWMRRAVVVACIVGAVCVVFGYSRTDHRWCSRCWAPVRTRELGLAITPDLRLPLWRSADASAATEPEIAGFLAPDHVHDHDAPGIGGSTSGPYVVLGEVRCGRNFPSEFAMALMNEPGFPDFVAARIADGTVDLATVRALIAEPCHRQRDDTYTADHLAFMHRGTDLYAAFHHTDPRTTALWADVDPRDRRRR